MKVCLRCGLSYAIAMERCGLDGDRLVESETDPLIGRTIDRYEILEQLGSGAMARVYRAKHTFLEREYAVKILMGQIAVDKTLSERFRREAQAVSQIKHVNVVEVQDFGVTSDGVTFLAMELLRGLTLADYLRREKITPPMAANITRQIASGLRAAQTLGFVHRDLKPGNVMMVEEGNEVVAKVLDFGLVQVGGNQEEDNRLTKTGQVFGTPAYMSPEQVEGKLVGPKADFYALGAILYELLTGAPPFNGGLHLVLAMHVTEPPKRIPEHGELGALAVRLLSKNPDDRAENAKEIIRTIDRMGYRIPDLSTRSSGESTLDSSPFVEPQKTINEVSLPPPGPRRRALGESMSVISRSVRESVGKSPARKALFAAALILILFSVPAGFLITRTAHEVWSERDARPVSVAAFSPEQRSTPTVDVAPTPPAEATHKKTPEPAPKKEAAELKEAASDKGANEARETKDPKDSKDSRDSRDSKESKPSDSEPKNANRGRSPAKPSPSPKPSSNGSGSSFKKLDLELMATLERRGLTLEDIAQSDPGRVKLWTSFRASSSSTKPQTLETVAEELKKAARSFYISQPVLKKKLDLTLLRLKAVPPKKHGPTFTNLENEFLTLQRELSKAAQAQHETLAVRILALDRKIRRL